MTTRASHFFEPVDETSLRDQVATNIRSAIDAGALKPGERLVEAEIATQMGISRAPVREAIRLLQQEGFVINIPRKGTFVVELTRKDFEEIFSLRSVLEALAINEAIPKMTPEDIDGLEDLVAEMHQAAKQRDFSKLVDCDLEFHQRIVTIAEHKRLYEIWQQMSTQLRLFLAMKDQLYSNLSDVAETHQPLIEAIRARDVDKARHLISEHIVDAGNLLLDSLNEVSNQDQREASYE